MADVQLEHGYLKIANALDEAILYADFTITQVKIVRCVIRLTYGWQRKTVRASHSEIAERCHIPNTGAFRRQLDELIREGVIVEVERPFGRTAAAYAINKNFEEWGRYSVPARALERLFNTRLPTIDTVPSSGHSNGSAPASAESPRLPPSVRMTAPLLTDDCPHEGIVAGSKCQKCGALVAPKDIERQERQLTTAPRAREDDELVQRYAIGLTTAANNAIAERWGESTRTRPLRWDLATSMAIEYLAIGIALELARSAIAEACRTSKNPKPPRSMNYFDGAITDAHKGALQRVLDSENPAPPGAKRGGSPQRIVNIVSAEANAEKHKVEQLYQRERADAARQWSEDPANKVAYTAITSSANTEFVGLLETTWGRKGRDSAILVMCATKAGFPTFDDWLKQHEAIAR